MHRIDIPWNYRLNRYRKFALHALTTMQAERENPKKNVEIRPRFFESRIFAHRAAKCTICNLQ